MLACASMPTILQEEAAKWVLPLCVTGLIGISGLLFSWAKEWSQDARKTRAIEQSTKRLDFWVKWLDAAQKNQLIVEQDLLDEAHIELRKTATIVYSEMQFGRSQVLGLRQPIELA